MTYTHLTTNELVMIEAYYQEGKTVCAIAKSLGRARQTIYNVISFLKTGHSAYDYYQRYKANKRYCISTFVDSVAVKVLVVPVLL